jgi:TRAP-type C4-dicarboxylate transport system permease small subunit
MRRLFAAYDRLLEGLGLLPGVIVGLIALAIGADVVLRDAGYAGIYGMTEIIEYAILVLAMAGVGHVTRLGRHVTVDVVPDMLPPHWTWRLSLLAQSIATLVSVVFLWFSTAATIEVWRSGTQLYKSFTLPEWLPLAIIPTGFFFVSIELLRRLVATFAAGELRRTAAATMRDDGI